MQGICLTVSLSLSVLNTHTHTCTHTHTHKSIVFINSASHLRERKARYHLSPLQVGWHLGEWRLYRGYELVYRPTDPVCGNSKNEEGKKKQLGNLNDRDWKETFYSLAIFFPLMCNKARLLDSDSDVVKGHGMHVAHLATKALQDLHYLLWLFYVNSQSTQMTQVLPDWTGLLRISSSLLDKWMLSCPATVRLKLIAH